MNRITMKSRDEKVVMKTIQTDCTFTSTFSLNPFVMLHTNLSTNSTYIYIYMMKKKKAVCC